MADQRRVWGLDAPQKLDVRATEGPFDAMSAEALGAEALAHQRQLLASLSASLMLPALPAGWMYEGWVVGPDGPVTTGRFIQATGADSDRGGPGAGPDATPAFPGQEFITPPVSLIGATAVISIEPEPDDSPGPFTLKPLVDMDIADVGALVLQDMANNAASFPTGTATR